MSQLTFYRTCLSLAVLTISALPAIVHAKPAKKSTIVATNQQALLACSKITDNIARLACFDKIAVGKIAPEVKAPLDIAKTLKVSSTTWGDMPHESLWDRRSMEDVHPRTYHR